MFMSSTMGLDESSDEEVLQDTQPENTQQSQRKKKYKLINNVIMKVGELLYFI